jgi:hypothetical protein
MRNILFLLLIVVLAVPAFSGTNPGSLTFSNTALLRPEGESEPAIAMASDGTMAITGLQWLFDPNFFGTHLYVGPFGSTPSFEGLLDSGLRQPGKIVFGSGDADLDVGSTNTLHTTTLIFFINPKFNRAQLGVSAITCPNVTSPSFSLSGCSTQFVDTTEADRDWITSDGVHVYLSYHDSGNSALIHVQRSEDDGFTWHRAGDPIVGQGGKTGGATFNNIQGNLVADPLTHNVYDIFASGQPGILKAKTATFNHVYVSRSTDGGRHWTANLVFELPPPATFANVFPSLAVDPTTGTVYAAFSEGHHVFFSVSTDQGTTWSPAVMVNIAPATTSIFPWVSAHAGTVDVVYYGTTAASKDDPSAVWNVYLAQTSDNGVTFAQSMASNSSNHTGVICTNGTGCAPGTRNLLDLFKVAINPVDGRAGIIYTDDTLTKDSNGNPLPQIVLAQQQ